MRVAAATGAGLALWDPLARAEDAATQVWRFHGEDTAAVMRACMRVIGENGGLGANVKTLALKVNCAFARAPEVGANTSPHVVEGFLKGCKEAGVGQVVLPELAVRPAARTFPMSGIQAVAQKHGAKMIDLSDGLGKRKHFETVEIPQGKKLKQAPVARHFLEADTVVNMPVAKHHGGAVLTIAMKNWLGIVADRGSWHRIGLPACIADFSTFMKPRWAIIDATRTMMDRGPGGPARETRTPHIVILSRDQVAADWVAAKLFHDDPAVVPYLRIARERGIGETRDERLNIHEIEVA